MLSKDDYVAKAAELVEDHFPKGECKERGNALVLVAEILVYLQNKGAIK